MNLFILGATGRTGVQLVEQGLARGHQVTAFVRSPDKVTLRSPGLTVKAGDPHVAAQLAAALPGHDAVLSALGTTSIRKPTTLLTECAQATLEAMREAKVQRLLVVSAGMLSPEYKGLVIGIVRFVLRHIITDVRGMEEVVQKSSLDWTLVRPPRLTGSKRRDYRAFEKPDGSATSLPFAGLAAFMLDEAERPGHVRKIVGVAT